MSICVFRYSDCIVRERPGRLLCRHVAKRELKTTLQDKNCLQIIILPSSGERSTPDLIFADLVELGFLLSVISKPIVAELLLTSAMVPVDALKSSTFE